MLPQVEIEFAVEFFIQYQCFTCRIENAAKQQTIAGFRSAFGGGGKAVSRKVTPIGRESFDHEAVLFESIKHLGQQTASTAIATEFAAVDASIKVPSAMYIDRQLSPCLVVGNV